MEKEKQKNKKTKHATKESDCILNNLRLHLQIKSDHPLYHLSNTSDMQIGRSPLCFLFGLPEFSGQSE